MGKNHEYHNEVRTYRGAQARIRHVSSGGAGGGYAPAPYCPPPPPQIFRPWDMPVDCASCSVLLYLKYRHKYVKENVIFKLNWDPLSKTNLLVSKHFGIDVQNRNLKVVPWPCFLSCEWEWREFGTKISSLKGSLIVSESGNLNC